MSNEIEARGTRLVNKHHALRAFITDGEAVILLPSP